MIGVVHLKFIRHLTWAFRIALLDNVMKAIIIRRAWALVLELADRHG